MTLNSPPSVMPASDRNGSAPDDFNPYASWFQIPATEAPLNAYQLLGLRELETDRKRIASAVERRRQELEVHRSGANTTLWHRVSRDIDIAAETLEDLELKAMLDADIRRQRAVRLGKESAQRLAAPPLLVCQGCALENTGGRSFCTRCGDALWRACPQCQFEGPVDEVYCGNCGANVAEAEQRLRATQQQRLDEAVELHAALRIGEALQRLRPLAVHEDPRLEGLIQQAQTLVRQWRAEQTEWRHRVQGDLEVAAACYARNEFDTAVRALERIPEEFRDERVKELLDKVTARCRELADLEQEIHQAAEQKAFSGLGIKVDRLLQLNPAHEPVRQLAGKLGKAFEHAAENKLTEGQYARARKLLDEVPRCAQGETYERLCERCHELLWLQQDLMQATESDETLLGVAERLAQACPADKQAAQCFAKLKTLRSPGHVPIPWTRSPEPPSALGIDVQHAPLWSRIDTQAVAKDAGFVQQLGAWHVAAGLALQGLELGAVSLNLVEEKARPLFRALGIGRRKAAPRSAWGIDLGATSLKAIEFRRAEDGRVAVQRFQQSVWEKPLHRIHDEAERTQCVAEVLQSLVAKYQLNEADRICVGLPAQWTLTRTVRIPPASDKQRQDAITFEAKHLFPIPLDQLAWDHQQLAAHANNPSPGGQTVPAHAVLAAAKRELVEARQAVLQRSGLRVDVLQSGALALYNLAAYEHGWVAGSTPAERPPSADSAYEAATAILDLGAESTSLVIGSPTLVWCRTLPITGDSFTDPLLKHLQLTYVQAEQVKREPLRAKRLHKLYAHFEPVVRELGSELRRTFDVFHKDYPRYRVQQLLLAGGGARLHGLQRLLRNGC